MTQETRGGREQLSSEADPVHGPVRLQTDAQDSRVAVLTLSRPPLNTFDHAVMQGLEVAAVRLHADTTIRSLVITGGRHFAAGADISELATLDAAELDRRNRRLQRAHHLIATAPQISIAAVNGYALGGGCELALAADLRYAGRSARLGLPEITLGIIPGSGGTQRLARLVGLSRAKQLILDGRQVGVEEALAIGLVDRVLDDDDVLAAALERARAYAAGPAALAWAKRAVDASVELPLEQGLRVEADAIAACFRSDDARAGMSSFLADGPGKATFSGS